MGHVNVRQLKLPELIIMVKISKASKRNTMILLPQEDPITFLIRKEEYLLRLVTPSVIRQAYGTFHGTRTVTRVKTLTIPYSTDNSGTG